MLNILLCILYRKSMVIHVTTLSCKLRHCACHTEVFHIRNKEGSMTIELNERKQNQLSPLQSQKDNIFKCFGVSFTLDNIQQLIKSCDIHIFMMVYFLAMFQSFHHKLPLIFDISTFLWPFILWGSSNSKKQQN